MALSAAVGAFNIGLGAAASTVTVPHGLGETPKAIIFWWGGRTESTNAGGSGIHFRGMGFAVSSSSFCAVANTDLDGIGTSNTDGGHREDACIIEMGNNVMTGWADVQSLDATNIVLEILDAFSVNLRVSFIAYGGSDITNAEIGRFELTGTAPVNQTVNNAGNFQPDITFFLSGVTADPPSVINASLISFGVAKDSSTERVLGNVGVHAQTSGDTASYCRAGECFGMPGAANAVTDRFEFVSHNASPGGFTINHLELANAFRVYYLSIKGGNWFIGDLVTQTDTTTAMTESGFGFTPAGVLFASACVAAHAQNAAAAHDEWSIGAATSASTRTAQQASSRDGNTNMFTQCFLRTDAVYINVDPTADTLEGQMDIQSFDSDGFTAIMDDADPAQAFVWYVAAGNVVTGRTTKNTRSWPLGVNVGMGWRMPV